MVSIRCLVYNHEPYLRQCLDGFVMQKTNFAFEAIVHDDCSTDKSAGIIREYAEKYPDIIKPIYETENQYSKHDGSLSRIMDSACKGQYIALCEGDDYWIDPLKLQRQVDFLENHMDYTMCFHNASILNETDSPQFPIAPIIGGDYNKNQIFENWMVPTASVIFRQFILNVITEEQQIFSGDINLFLTCASLGKVHGFYERMSVYRIQNNGLTLKRINKNKVEVYKKEREQCDFLYRKFQLNKTV